MSDKQLRGPMMLIDMTFNIPIYNANSQMYICTEVAPLGQDGGNKSYGIYFKEIPKSYSVPEVLRLDIKITAQSKMVEVQLFEKTASGNYIPLYNKSYDYTNITSRSHIETMIKDLIKD